MLPLITPNGQKVTITERADADGLLSQRDFGGTKKWRTCYVADGTGHALALRRMGEDGAALLLVVSFDGPLSADLEAHEETRGRWELLLSSEEARFGGEAEGAIARLSPDGRLEMSGAGAVVLQRTA